MKSIKVFFIGFFALMAVFGLTAVSHAALVDNGDGTITDTDRDLMWLQDANYAMTSGYDADGMMKWDAAMTWADTLEYAGYDDWKLPSALNSDGTGPCTSYNCTDSDLGHLYYIELGLEAVAGSKNYGPFINGQHYYYWYETETIYDKASDFHLGVGLTTIGVTKTADLYALAVRSTAVAPEPISTVLFVVGGVTLGVRRYGKR